MKESERKEILEGIVKKHLTALKEGYGYSKLIEKFPNSAKELLFLKYEEMKAEIFLNYIPVKQEELLPLFNECLKGTPKNFYEDILKYDLELGAMSPKGWVEEPEQEDPEKAMVREYFGPLSSTYIQLLNVPDKFIAALEGAFEKCIKRLEENGHPMAFQKLLDLAREELPKVHKAYFKTLKKYEGRMSAIRSREDSGQYPVVRKGRPLPLDQPPLLTVNLPSGHIEKGWKRLIREQKEGQTPKEYYGAVKALLSRWMDELKDSPGSLHRFFYDLYQKAKELSLSLSGQGEEIINEDVMKSKFLEAALGIALAQTAEGAMRQNKSGFSVQS